MVWFLLSFLAPILGIPLKYSTWIHRISFWHLLSSHSEILSHYFLKDLLNTAFLFKFPGNLMKTILLPTSIYKMNFTLAGFFLTCFYIYNIYFHRVTHHVRIYDLNHCTPKICDAWKTFLINKIHTGVDTHRTWISAYKNLMVKICDPHSSLQFLYQYFPNIH